MAESSNDELRKRSGIFASDSKLVSFLYELLRDHVSPSTMETVTRASVRVGPTIFTNGWIARYAYDIAERLVGAPDGLHDSLNDHVADWRAAALEYRRSASLAPVGDAFDRCADRLEKTLQRDFK